MKRFDGPCGDSTCYRGAYGSSGPGGAMIYADGPCNAADCKWPTNIPPRPSLQTPSKPIVDAGAVALAERKAAQ